MKITSLAIAAAGALALATPAGAVNGNTATHAWVTDGPVYTVAAIARKGAVLFVAGDFTKIGGRAVSRIAAIDIATGRPLDWDPLVRAKKLRDDAYVDTLAVSPDGGTLFFSGDFALVRGNRR